jgi:hypothetical protein
MIKSILYISAIALLFFSSCKPSVKPEDLYGKWKYTKLESPNANPPSVEPDWKLKIEAPYIEFLKNNDLIMHFSGEVLAHGKFRTDGDKIMFNQVLDGGQTREFPFYVIELTDKQIVFETRGEDAARVTAIRE